MKKDRFLDPEDFNRSYPVSGVEIYGGLVKVTRYSRSESRRGNDMSHKPQNEQVVEFSKRSRVRMLATLAMSKNEMRSLMTLTYGVNYPLSGKVSKGDLNSLLTRFRYRYGGHPYFWFMEFQRRGAPHYHILTDVVPGNADREWLGRVWANVLHRNEDWLYSNVKDGTTHVTRLAVMAVHGHPRSWEMIRTENGAIRYLSKYAYKPKQKKVPKEYRDCGRFWGASSGFCKKEPDIAMDMTEDEVRMLLSAKGIDTSGWEILPKYCFT